MKYWAEFFSIFALALVNVSGSGNTAFRLSYFPQYDLPDHPYQLQYHSTRYQGGCFSHLPPSKNFSFNPILPFLRNFHLIVTSCGMDWTWPGKKTAAIGSCVYAFRPSDPSQRTFYAHYNLSAPSSLLEPVMRISVHSDRRHHSFFVDRVLPALTEQINQMNRINHERAPADGQGANYTTRFIVHSGGGDQSISRQHAEAIVNQSLVRRWVVEGNRLHHLAAHPKVVQLPIGLCYRENSDSLGEALRRIMDEEENQEDRIKDTEKDTEKDRDRDRDKDMKRRWKQRLNRVFFCFHDLYGGRKEVLEFVRNNSLPFADVCDYPLSHEELWRAYRRYKFVFSPMGSGADCFRTWEILLLGAIPVVPFFPGLLGYLEAGLTVIGISDLRQLNPETVETWVQRYDGGSDRDLLTRDYWNKRIFDY